MSDFSLMPTISITRSKFTRKPTVKTSFKLGDLIPIRRPIEVLPGDTFNDNLNSLIRMSTPIAPIMDNIYYDVFVFFVPSRLCWKNFKKFMGEADNAGIEETEYYIPKVDIGGDAAIGLGTIGDYMGLPHVSGDKETKVSVLPLRAYKLIYNRWFRDQNLIPKEVEYNDDDTSEESYNIEPLKGAKLSDYFTRCLPYAQKSEPVEIGLSGLARVNADGDSFLNIGIVNDNDNFMFSKRTITGDSIYEEYNESLDDVNDIYYTFRHKSDSAAPHSVIQSTPSVLTYDKRYPLFAKIPDGKTNLVTDLSSASATTINQLRAAFALQRFSEKQCLYGSRYAETLKAFFGVTSPDASLQDPQYLGGKRINVNIDQVLSTAGYSADDTTKVGATGANSVTGNSNSLFTFSATEHGYILILGCARHKQTYGQALNRMWTRDRKFDFYFPTFANLGAQSVKNSELCCLGSDGDDDIFGYQEAWAEYRYEPDMVSGLLNPARDNSLGFWTLANNFAEHPTLAKTFIEQDRENIARCLTTGVNGPDFIADFMFDEVVVRPMPLYSIPGLIDHH